MLSSGHAGRDVGRSRNAEGGVQRTERGSVTRSNVSDSQAPVPSLPHAVLSSGHAGRDVGRSRNAEGVGQPPHPGADRAISIHLASTNGSADSDTGGPDPAAFLSPISRAGVSVMGTRCPASVDRGGARLERAGMTDRLDSGTEDNEDHKGDEKKSTNPLRFLRFLLFHTQLISPLLSPLELGLSDLELRPSVSAAPPSSNRCASDPRRSESQRSESRL